MTKVQNSNSQLIKGSKANNPENSQRHSNRQSFVDYLHGYRITPNRNLGQNFLYDPQLLAAMITEMELGDDYVVIEIGAGTGNLTALLAETVSHVLAIEIDANLYKALNDRFMNNPKVELCFADALKKFDFPKPEVYDDKKLAIVGNLPYYISTKLILHFLIYAEAAEKFTYLLQSDFIKRVLASKDSKEYGPLNILLATLTEADSGMVLNAANFYPAPQVESSLIHIKVKPEFTRDSQRLKAYYDFLKIAFSQRRKMISNTYPNLVKKYTHLQTITMEDYFGKCDLSPKLRPENIEPADWLKLYNIASGDNLLNQ